MSLRCLPKSLVGDFIEHIAADRKLVGVREKQAGHYEFAEVDGPEEMVLDYQTTPLPPKTILFPPTETMMRISLGEAPSVEPVIDETPLAIVGIHPCDLHGIKELDMILGGDREDPNYFARRRNALLVGVDCKPDDHCFCAAVGSATAEDCCDIFMTDLGDQYAVESFTDAGTKLVESFDGAEQASGETLTKMRQCTDAKCAAVEHELKPDLHAVPMLLEGKQSLKDWDPSTGNCVSCGACNIACPTCNCFDVYDEVDITLSNVERKRRWDGCMLRGFTEVAGGEVFRSKRADRLRHRMQRKYNYQYIKYGVPFCTGCGRCARTCPAGIHPVTVINEVTTTS